MPAIVAMCGLYTSLGRSAHDSTQDMGESRELCTDPRPPTSANTLRCGLAWAGVDCSLGVQGREFASLRRAVLALPRPEAEVRIVRGSLPVPVLSIFALIPDRTWTATPIELFGIRTQVISRKLFDHDSTTRLES